MITKNKHFKELIDDAMTGQCIDTTFFQALENVLKEDAESGDLIYELALYISDEMCEGLKV